RRRRHDQIQTRFQRGDALRDRELQGVHVVEIAPPSEALAFGVELKAGEISDGAGGSVLARNPLGIVERERTGFDRNLQGRMQEFLRGTAGVHGNLDRGGSGCGSGNFALLSECGSSAQGHGKRGTTSEEGWHNRVLSVKRGTRLKKGSENSNREDSSASQPGLCYTSPFLFAGRRFLLRAGHAGNQFVEGLFGRHFFTAAFVVAVCVFVVAGAAAGAKHFFAHHGNNGVVSAAFAAGTMIVNIIAEAHRWSLIVLTIKDW